MINEIKVEKVAEQAIAKLNRDELDWLIAYLVDYKEGSVLLRTAQKVAWAWARAFKGKG